MHRITYLCKYIFAEFFGQQPLWHDGRGTGKGQPETAVSFPMLLDGDATATVFASLIAVPMFFCRRAWFA